MADDSSIGRILIRVSARHLLLLAVIGVAACLRALTLSESLWLDELHTAWTVADSLSEVAKRAHEGNNGPLFFWLQWLTVQTLGFREWTLRLWPFLAGVSIVTAVYYLVRHWTASQTLAVLAATLAALDDNCLFFAREARPYALIQLLAVAQLFLFWQLLHHVTSLRRCFWIVVTVLMFYLHPTSALTVPGQIVCWLLSRVAWGNTAYQASHFVTDLALVGLSALPASTHLPLVAERRANWAKFVSQPPFWAVFTIYPLSCYLLLPMILVTLGRAKSYFSKTPHVQARVDPQTSTLCLCYLFVPLVITWWLTEQDIARLFFRRYVIAASSVPILLAAVIGGLLRSRNERVLYACVVLAGCICVTGPADVSRNGIRIHRHSHENWRDAVALINQRYHGTRIALLVRSGLIEADSLREDSTDRFVDYCLLPVLGIYQCNSGACEMFPVTTSRVRVSERAKAAIARAEMLVLLTNGNRQRRESIIQGVQEELGAAGLALAMEFKQDFNHVSVVEFRAIDTGASTR